jgi:MFS family permease
MIAYYCCALVSFLLFALSDKYGRKLVLLACVCGQLFYSAVHVVQFHYSLSLYFQILANTVNGLTGGQSVLLGVAFAGLADISRESGSKYRALRISIGELCIGFGGFVFSR